MRNYYGEYNRYYRSLSGKNIRHHNMNYGYKRGNKNLRNKKSILSLEHVVKLTIRQLVIVLILLISYIAIKFVDTPEVRVVHIYISNALAYNQDFNEYINKAMTLKWSDVEDYANETYKYIDNKLKTLKSQ